jgi:hypothetical protein
LPLILLPGRDTDRRRDPDVDAAMGATEVNERGQDSMTLITQ